MATEKRDLLEVLRVELEFLKGGRYRTWSSWRPQFIFEDSPTCLNHGDPERKTPCSECVMMQLVPAEFRQGTPPCHYIPLNERNDTIQSLHQWSAPEELEDAVGERLMNTIQKLELGRIQGQPELQSSVPGVGTGVAETLGVTRQCSSSVQIRIARKLLTIVRDGCFVFTTISRTVKRPRLWAAA